MRETDVKLYLASGTDEKDVVAEAKLLGLDRWFDGGIYGAHDDQTDCAKETVIKRILTENDINGAELLAFGDGYVEIELVRNVGGYAVAVATDEARNAGINTAKRDRLKAAGAAMVIPNFENSHRLCKVLFGGR